METIDAADHTGLVYHMLTRHADPAYMRDDMESEYMLALVRASRAFDPDLGFKFSTYACRSIERCRYRVFDVTSRRRRTGIGFTESGELGEDGLSYAERTLMCTDADCDPANICVADEERTSADRTLRRAMSKLLPVTQDGIIRRYGLFGYAAETTPAIAERHGTSRESMRQRIRLGISRMATDLGVEDGLDLPAMEYLSQPKDDIRPVRKFATREEFMGLSRSMASWLWDGVEGKWMEREMLAVAVASRASGYLIAQLHDYTDWPAKRDYQTDAVVKSVSRRRGMQPTFGLVVQHVRDQLVEKL